MVARINTGAQHEDPEGVVRRDERGFLYLEVREPEPEKPARSAPVQKKKE